jgi:putative NIF3 family GTP cyclohydrolase 1 type 2
MTAATLSEKNLVKAALIEVIEERPELFKAIIKEIIAEGKANSLFDEEVHLQELDAIITKDFKRFDKVFKALA